MLKREARRDKREERRDKKVERRREREKRRKEDREERREKKEESEERRERRGRRTETGQVSREAMQRKQNCNTEGFFPKITSKIPVIFMKYLHFVQVKRGPFGPLFCNSPLWRACGAPIFYISPHGVPAARHFLSFPFPFGFHFCFCFLFMFCFYFCFCLRLRFCF